MERAKSLLRRTRKEEPDADALLKSFAERVTQHELDALAATGELPFPAPPAGAGALQSPDALALLRRFVAAESWDVGKAAARLAAHAEWRLRAIPPGGIPDGDVAAQLEEEKLLLQAPGAKGLPLLIIRARNHHPAGYDSIARFIIYGLEAAAAMADAQESKRVVVLMDLAGLQLKNLDAQALRACFQLLNAHFPERLAYCLMLNAPTIFWGLWQLVRPFIDPATQQKVKFVEGGTAEDTLQDLLGADVVPKEYGGDADPVRIEQAVKGLREQWQRPALAQPPGKAVGAGEDGEEPAADHDGHHDGRHHKHEQPHTKLHHTQPLPRGHKARHGHQTHGTAQDGGGAAATAMEVDIA